MVRKEIYMLGSNGERDPHYAAFAEGITEGEAIAKAREQITGALSANWRLRHPNPNLSKANFVICNPDEIPPPPPIYLTRPGMETLMVRYPGARPIPVISKEEELVGVDK